MNTQSMINVLIQYAHQWDAAPDFRRMCKDAYADLLARPTSQKIENAVSMLAAWGVTDYTQRAVADPNAIRSATRVGARLEYYAARKAAADAFEHDPRVVQARAWKAESLRVSSEFYAEAARPFQQRYHSQLLKLRTSMQRDVEAARAPYAHDLDTRRFASGVVSESDMDRYYALLAEREAAAAEARRPYLGAERELNDWFRNATASIYADGRDEYNKITDMYHREVETAEFQMHAAILEAERKYRAVCLAQGEEVNGL